MFILRFDFQDFKWKPKVQLSVHLFYSNLLHFVVLSKYGNTVSWFVCAVCFVAKLDIFAVMTSLSVHMAFVVNYDLNCC